MEEPTIAEKDFEEWSGYDKEPQFTLHVTESGKQQILSALEKAEKYDFWKEEIKKNLDVNDFALVISMVLNKKELTNKLKQLEEEKDKLQKSKDCYVNEVWNKQQKIKTLTGRLSLIRLLGTGFPDGVTFEYIEELLKEKS